jgi:hypothetical protein
MMTERKDRLVVHEPFSQVVDFGEVEVGEQIARSEQDVLAALRGIAAGSPECAPTPVFFKDTTDFHYPAVLADQDFLARATHTFIIRHPAEAIASHHALNPDLGRDEIGFARLFEIFAAVQDATGAAPVVIDSDDLLDRPAETVRAYCAAVGIPFVAEALNWQPGMRSEWRATSKWHASTSATAGFRRGGGDDGNGGNSSADRDASRAKAVETVQADPVLRAYCDYHLPYYEKLRAAALRP